MRLQICLTWVLLLMVSATLLRQRPLAAAPNRVVSTHQDATAAIRTDLTFLRGKTGSIAKDVHTIDGKLDTVKTDVHEIKEKVSQSSWLKVALPALIGFVTALFGIMIKDGLLESRRRERDNTDRLLSDFGPFWLAAEARTPPLYQVFIDVDARSKYLTCRHLLPADLRREMDAYQSMVDATGTIKDKDKERAGQLEMEIIASLATLNTQTEKKNERLKRPWWRPLQFWVR